MICQRKPEQIISLSTKVREVVAYLKSANAGQHLTNPTLLHELIGKLPNDKQLSWLEYANALRRLPNIADFSDWLSRLARIVGQLPGVIKVSSKTTIPKSLKPILHANTQDADEKCVLCKGDLYLNECKKWKEDMNIDDR